MCYRFVRFPGANVRDIVIMKNCVMFLVNLNWVSLNGAAFFLPRSFFQKRMNEVVLYKTDKI